MAIDLGRKLDYPEPCCAPSQSNKSDTQRIIYPSLYIEGGPELRDVPSEGVMKLRYRTREKTESTRDGEKKRTRLELEALEIISTDADDTPPKSRDAELDDLRDKVAGDDEDEE